MVIMKTEPFDILQAFLAWWYEAPRNGIPVSVHDGVSHVGCCTGLVLYRQPPFQVELWILAPNTDVGEHAHPNVDIFLVHVTGEIFVNVDGKPVLTEKETVADERGITKTNGNFIRIRPGQKHRATTGPLGGAFLNVQLWMDGKPRSTDRDWQGQPINEEHKKKLIGYARSLPEPSDYSRKERPLIFKRALVTPVSPEGSTSKPSNCSGEPSLDPAPAASG